MQIATTNTIAKIAAVLAGLGLVASTFAAFAPAANAQSSTSSADLQAQINALLAQIAALQANTGTSASVSFDRDLTMGSTGADVTALQNWLISKGFTIAAGATGYFGAQTKAALGAYQASVSISPASGYFGPITRAKVNASAGTGGTGTGTGTGSGNGDSLSGGEASLTDYNFRSEDGSGDEGENGVDIATAEFDVDDGDARVERVKLTFVASNASLEDRPWKYFDSIEVSANGDKLGDVDASDKDEWDETTSGSDIYVLTMTGLDYVVEEGDTAELLFTADVADSIDAADLDQTFLVYVDNNGIRAVDGEGIQQYIGQDTDTVTFGFGAEDNGDLTIKSNNSDPDASILVGDADDTSADYDVFVFDIDNSSDADAIINDIEIGVTTGTGTSALNIIRDATLTVDGDDFDGDIASTTITFDDMDLQVAGDERVEAVLSITLKRSPVETTLVFDVVGSTDVDAEGADSGDNSAVSGSQTSSTHTVALEGIAVEPVSTSQSVVTPGSDATATYGTYTIKFDVTAIEDDAYIATTTSTTGTVGVTYAIDGTTYTGTTTALLTSSADTDTGYYVVGEGDTEEFTLTVTLDPASAGTFEVDLSSIRFNNAASFTGASTLTIDTNNSDYQTDPIYIAN